MIIRLNEMVFYGYHGVQDEERKLGQRFVVTVEMHTYTGRDAHVHHLTETVDYTKVYADIRELMESHQFHLLEHCADKVADKLLADFPLVEQIRVCIQKPSVPIQGILKSVEVELTRSRS